MSKKARTKLKTIRGAAKRFKISGSGKVRFRRAHRAHIRTKQSGKSVRQGRTNGVLGPADAPLARRMLNEC